MGHILPAAPRGQDRQNPVEHFPLLCAGAPRAGGLGEFADCDATASVEVGSGDVLDEPARLLKHLIDGLARFLFRVFHLVLFPFAYQRCRDWLVHFQGICCAFSHWQESAYLPSS